eukprot:11914-Heterococcus_DN1.PRE.1
MTSANCAKISYPLVAANTEAGAVRVAVAIASPIVLRIYDLKIVLLRISLLLAMHISLSRCSLGCASLTCA